MSDKFNKTGLSSGSSWSLLTENTAFEEPDSILEKEEQCSSSTRLHVQDSSKFGLCPARECLQLAVCKHCQKLVLLSSIQRHYELKHQKFLSSVKPSLPRRCIPSAGHNIIPKSPPIMHSKPSTLLNTSSGKSFIRIEEVNPNELNVKIEEVPLTIPQFNTVNKGKLSRINIKKLTNDSIKKHNNNSNNNSNNSNKNNNNNNSINSSNIHNNNNNSSSNTSCSNFNNTDDISPNCTEAITSPVNSPQVCIQVKGNFKKIPHLKVKEYDVDKHCGVWIPEMEQNCTRSFTCKTHPLSLRRQVPGRSKDFDVLLAEHRAKVALKVQENSSNVTSSSSQTSSVSNTNSPFGFDRIVFPTVRVPSSTTPKDTAGSSIKSVIGSPPVSKSISEDAAQPNCEYSSQVFVDYILDEIIGSSNLPSTSVFPKPISTNTFGRRQTDCKCHVYSRRMDHFRNATSSMLDRFNSSSTFASLNPTDPTKVGKDGLRLAVQDPLQNGILYKQKTKTAKISGTKRHLSATENQGIIADSINYVANSKRRHSSEVAVVDPFSITNPPSICRSVSYPAHSGQQLVKVKEFQRTNENNLICHRPKLNDSLTNSVAVSSSEYLIISTSAKVEKLSSTTGTPNLTLNSNLNLCHSLGITKTDTAVNLRQGSFDQTFSSLSKISAAPNITITQGMIVSLPPAVLQNNQQNIYSIGNQIKDLITNSSPTRTVQQVSTTPPALKQALVDGNMSSFQNGINPSGDKNYSYGTSDKQELAPNITVTASSALSGVLQGHVVSATLSMPKSNFKRLNSAHSDQTGLLQQIVVQQSNPSSRDLSAYKTTRSPTTTQTLLSPSVTSTISNSTVTSRQSFLNSPSNANSNNSQPIKHLQKMQLHQLQQQQLQNQQFIVHHGYQQQILPKLPTVPNSMTQFNASQFSTSGSQGSLQFLTQGTNSNSLQQQHGGALS